MPIDLPQIAAAIEHTLLRPDATAAQLHALCAEAREHRFHGVCVSPRFVPLAAAELADSTALVVSVVGFPHCGSQPETVAVEARRALADGARELDMVIPVGLALAGELTAVTDFVGIVREAAGDAPLKVILETGYFEPPQLEALCEAVLLARPAFLKTSTGFGPRGATVEDVELMTRVSAGRAAVKAAGGVRDRATAERMLAAGATRLGTSNGVAIVRGAVANGY